MNHEIYHLFYRGALRSCNYCCAYCPFGKQTATSEDGDREALDRFVSALEHLQQKRAITVLITPYGEAMIRPYYWDALARLSKSKTIAAVSCQTNLSFDCAEFLSYLSAHRANHAKLFLWGSFHPTMTTAEAFSEKVRTLSKQIGISVGAVANPTALPAIRHLRALLPEGTPFWLNQMDGLGRRCTPEERAAFTALDPAYPLEEKRHRTTSCACGGGTQSYFIEADGSARACCRSHAPLGNLYDGTLVTSDGCDGKCDCFLAYSCRKDLPALLFAAPFPQLRLRAKPVHALFFDLDGTLAPDGAPLSDATAMLLERLSRRYAIFLATGLPFAHAMRRCKRAHRFLSGGIFDYGADIRDFQNRTHQITPFQNLPALAGNRPLAVAKSGGMPYKFLIRAEAGERFEGCNAFFEGAFTALVPPGVDKAAGVSTLCRLNGWQEDEVFVMGNGESDVTMLQSFPFSAAPPKAHKQAKAAARFILELSDLDTFLLGAKIQSCSFT